MQQLVFERVGRFAVQAVGIPIDDLKVATVALIACEMSQVGTRRSLDGEPSGFCPLDPIGRGDPKVV
ncbi:MAG: hypothetical protein ABSE57_12100 [Bryobacteraceae bacterium]|jgi:hypothetical protein